MTQSIFFSWQSDTDTRTGRNFVTDVLERVCKNIANDTSVEEAQRDMSVDSDTKGAAGRPPIVDTIFQKIDESAVYVADVTFVGNRIDGRLTPNPNVLIEYGWALKSRTHQRVITVMNTAYGEPSETSLPFNMKHMLWPITYNLPTRASAEEKATVRDGLIKELTSVVKASLALAPVVAMEVDTFPQVEAKNGPARFRAENEPLGFSDNFAFEEPKEIFLAEGSEMWLRLIPFAVQGKQWPVHELKEKLRKDSGNLMPLVHGSGGQSFLVAEDGAGMYIAPIEKDATQEVTQGVGFAFASGEIWGIDTALLAYGPKNLYQGDIEQSFASSLQNYSRFLSGLGVEGSYRWIAGMRGIKGRSLGYPPPPGKTWIRDRGPICMTDLIEIEGEFNPETQTPTEALLPFFKKIFEKCVVARPDYLPQK